MNKSTQLLPLLVLICLKLYQIIKCCWITVEIGVQSYTSMEFIIGLRYCGIVCETWGWSTNLMPAPEGDSSKISSKTFLYYIIFLTNRGKNDKKYCFKWIQVNFNVSGYEPGCIILIKERIHTFLTQRYMRQIFKILKLRLIQNYYTDLYEIFRICSTDNCWSFTSFRVQYTAWLLSLVAC